jgi:ketosteroid isomerase-like protein
MGTRYCSVLLACAISLLFAGCVSGSHEARDLVHDPFVDRQWEIREAVMSIKRDIEASNIAGLQATHLEGEKFTKFGPRSFERQDVAGTNESEAAFFGSISNAKYEARDLKIDVFGDVGIATYYPEVSFVRDGNEVVVSGRQTLVFLKTDSGWKLVHEHGTVRRE